MVGVEGITDWVGREVVDREGEKVGKLAEVYYDTTDSEPAFVSVKSGTFGRSHSLAPLRGATLARDYVRLDASKELIKDAPSEDAGGRLSGVDAIAVLGHYGLPSEPDLEGEDRVCFQTVAAAEETERKRAEVDAEQAREAGGAAAGGTVHADDRHAAPQRDRDLIEDDRHDAPRSDRDRMDDDRHAAPQPDRDRMDDDRHAAPQPDRNRMDDDRHAAPQRDRDLMEDDRHDAPRTDRDRMEDDRHTGPSPALSAPAPTAAPYTSADDDPLARLEQLERRVAALEARLG